MDKIVTNKCLAIPLFFAIMGVVFYITFGALGPRLSDLVGGFINGTLAQAVRGLLTGVGAADWATGLVCDGIIAGLGAVLAFLPQILLLFFFLSILEDSGLSLIHISEPTRLGMISYAVFCLKKKKK